MLSWLLSVVFGFGTPQSGLPAPQPAALFCQTDLPAMGLRRIAWFNLTVDQAYKRQDASLYLTTGDFEAQLTYDEDEFARPDAMEGFRYDLILPRGVKFPATVDILFDGRLASARLYPAPQMNALVYRDGHVEGYQSLELTEDRVPNIYGHRSMVARVVGADGKVAIEDQIPLPDWAWVKQEARKAERYAEALRRKRRCIPAD
ncbi:MAG: hypothetical protein WCI21_02970 [Alphaproteobacteria bacterium]